MRSVVIEEFGGVEGIAVRGVADPSPPSATEVLIRVKAAGLNRADLLQRKGVYSPPKGIDPKRPGLEFAGEIIAVGANARKFSVGDRVFGITAGEAQAELLLSDESLLAFVPDGLTYDEAGGIPEVFVTANDAVFDQGKLESGGTLLVHAVGSGVGLAALQLAKAAGCTVIGTSRTSDKLDRCVDLGLDHSIDTGSDADFSTRVLELTDGRGADVILDLVGGAYFGENMKSSALKGSLILVGLSAGSKSEIDLAVALHKRLHMIGTVLRSRPVDEKAAAMRSFEKRVLPLLRDGKANANIDRVFPADDIRQAHQYLESNESFGKVVISF